MSTTNLYVRCARILADAIGSLRVSCPFKGFSVISEGLVVFGLLLPELLVCATNRANDGDYLTEKSQPQK